MFNLPQPDQEYVCEMAAKWHIYDRLLTQRSSIICTYPNYKDVMDFVYQEASHPVDFMPEDQVERELVAKQMEERIESLKNSDDLSEVLRAAFFLSRKIARDTSDRGTEVQLETLLAKTELHRADSLLDIHV
ncbi:hypothetical protein FB446DRAFT_784041 [Lentinula raphanica]|nr:hypothetical protein FB446DRAFT_784041 [Lentinula raphanica]